MNYKKLYEKQYEEGKLVNVPQRQFWGLRRLLKKYDWDRYYVTNQLVGRGGRVLDVGCGDGHLLFMVEDRFEELFGVDISPSRIQEAEDKVKQIFPSKPVASSPYNWEEIGWDGGHIHYFTMDKFCWLFESNGFRVERKSGSGFLSKFRNWWPSFLTGDLIIKAVKTK